MDQDLLYNFSIAIALIMAFFTFIMILIQRYTTKISSKRNLPPGPRTLPIIGNMHQLIFSPLLHRCLADLAKKHGPVMYIKLGSVDHVVLSSKAAAEEVLRTHDALLADRAITIAAKILTYNCRSISFAPYGEYWKQMKKLFVVHLASTKQVESFRSVREAEVATLVTSIMDSSRSGSPVNLSKMSYSLMTSIISKATFGDSCKRVDAFTPLIPRIVEILLGFNIAEFFPSIGILDRVSGVRYKVERLHKEIDEVLEGVIGEYKASKAVGRAKANEILGVLLDFQDQGDPEIYLSMEDIKGILFDVFTGGVEASATVLDWAMSEILRHPKVMKRVQAEVRQLFQSKSSVDESCMHQLKYMNLVIKETLRLHIPAPLLLPREVRQRLTINGYEIPPKMRVFINAWAIARDPKIWTDAEMFCPERFLETSVDYKGNHLEFIPFSAGRRMCPGMMFGMSTVELALANLLYHFNWELPDGLVPESLDMSEAFGAAARRKFDLCLIATQYCP